MVQKKNNFALLIPTVLFTVAGMLGWIWIFHVWFVVGVVATTIILIILFSKSKKEVKKALDVKNPGNRNIERFFFVCLLGVVLYFQYIPLVCLYLVTFCISEYLYAIRKKDFGEV